MALFQHSVLKDQLRLQDEQQVNLAYKKFTSFFHNPDIQENIRSSKEEQFQDTFLNELFVKVLGLQTWHELEFGDFIKELNKAIKASNKVRAKEAAVLAGENGDSPTIVEVPTLTKKDEFEWMELFEENKQKALELQREIEKTDKEMDTMVYELYGLTEEEIKVVEGV